MKSTGSKMKSSWNLPSRISKRLEINSVFDIIENEIIFWRSSKLNLFRPENYIKCPEIYIFTVHVIDFSLAVGHLHNENSHQNEKNWIFLWLSHIEMDLNTNEIYIKYFVCCLEVMSTEKITKKKKENYPFLCVELKILIGRLLGFGHILHKQAI